MRIWFNRLSVQKQLTVFLAIVWTILIFVGCTLPGRHFSSVKLFNHADKVIHFVFFFIFFLLWYRYRPAKWLILVLAILYGFGLEFYQANWVKGRSFDVWDGVADTFGAGIALLTTAGISKKK